MHSNTAKFLTMSAAGAGAAVGYNLTDSETLGHKINNSAVSATMMGAVAGFLCFRRTGKGCLHRARSTYQKTVQSSLPFNVITKAKNDHLFFLKSVDEYYIAAECSRIQAYDKLQEMDKKFFDIKMLLAQAFKSPEEGVIAIEMDGKDLNTGELFEKISKDHHAVLVAMNAIEYAR
jgi:hypothetical protein